MVDKKRKEIDVYESYGATFMSEWQARDHEAKMKRYMDAHYYVVHHHPDLTEGRGFQKQTVYGVVSHVHPYELLLHYLAENLGKPMAYVMGVSPTPNYTVHDQGGAPKDTDRFLAYLDEMTRSPSGQREPVPIQFITNEGNLLKRFPSNTMMKRELSLI